jgi:sortase A
VSHRLRRVLGLSCLVTGAVLLLYAASVTLRGTAWQRRAAALLPEAEAESAGAPGTPAIAGPARPPERAAPPRRGDPFARLRIERLGLDVAVAEGTDRRTLSRGPGHMEGSAHAGEPDNCIIAGHRDGPFARLRSARPGDIVEVTGRGATALYRIDDISIVDRGNVAPLAPAKEPVLTLVTCYPFHYVGKAPRRFIARASLIDPCLHQGVLNEESAERDPRVGG